MSIAIVKTNKSELSGLNIDLILILILILPLILSFGCQPSLPDDVKLAYQELPDKVDFNFHIKPILADRCYKCHGPDDNAREADFRLDIEEKAFAKLKESGGHAFIKGNIAKSVAWKRITSEDQEFHMPPPESNLSLSAKEKALITKWIEQGAVWKEHWAFMPPKIPPVPFTTGTSLEDGVPEDLPANWKAGNSIDHFILAKLKEQGLSPSSVADKERLIRRVTMDLTGLPPTIQEIDDFISDDSPEAYEKLVDRLLTTDAHAERMAMEWLDVARFGDTQGMHVDAERFNWPWRDWVIGAFKKNMPYDDFIIWQMAGDLLPNATQDQKLATAFHRNHPVTAEGGVISEEFRQRYVQDRNNTTAMAFLGLTLECATCHDHKFDPISQKEYYQMSAFFNNLKEIGMVAEGGDASGPVLLLLDPEVKEDLAEVSEQIDRTIAQRELTKSEVAANRKFIESIQQNTIRPPAPDALYPLESVRPKKTKLDNTTQFTRVFINNPLNKIVDDNPKSLASGETHVVKGKIGNALRLAKEDDMILLTDVGNFEINEPFSAGGWINTEKEGENQTIMGTSGDLVSYWRGWDLLLDNLNRPSIQMTSFWPHNYMQITADLAIPKEEWHHVFFTYDGSARASGLQLYVNGKKTKSKTNYDNLYRSIVHESPRSNVDRWEEVDGLKQRPVIVGRSGRHWTGENSIFTGSFDHLSMYNRHLTALEVAGIAKRHTNDPIDKVTFDEDDYEDHYLNRMHPGFQNLTKELRDLVAKKLRLLDDVKEIMVMEDMPESRKTFVLNRGQYDSPTEEVLPGTPQKVLAFKEGLPKNRLGLALWLTDPENPLTARVAVNRYWQMIFGRGIVETPHDFGTQGALPTHPDLLDWLALHFIESDWNLRDLIKTMVMSLTYRQSSVATPEHMAKDPRNLYMAHAPSYRLQAEMIRDNAIAASGLLAKKVGGASVKPYQPDGVWGFSALFSGPYEVDSGANLYRRSMYTYVRRTAPHPAMVAFDAPNRSVCIVKRENTNTPLQALVLLNDPQFVEAARVLAQRMQLEGGESLEDKIRYGFRLLCGRKPGNGEKQLMKKQYELSLERYKKNPKEANELLQVGEYAFDNNLDKIQTAALAMVANTMMNFDEAYMKR